MSSEIIVDRIAALPLFQSVPRNALEWMVQHGEVRFLPAGTIVDTFGPATTVDEMWILLAGTMGLHRRQGGTVRRLQEVTEGQVAGVLPFSRFQRPPGFVAIEKDVTGFVLHRDHFPVMIRDYPELTAVLVHYMIDRAREYRAIQLNDERLDSLSKLASGFAHELNNPASAAARTAQSLVRLLDEEERTARELAAARLADGQLAAVDALRNECGRTAEPRTALEAADREDDIADWLARNGLDAGSAEALAASNVTMGSLEQLGRALPREALGIAVRWVAAGCAVRGASQQIKAATARIHDLVEAVKGFTFMDRQGVPEEVDIARGLADTLSMLEGKARAKSATVHLETADNLPRPHGFGSDLNQVWQKLVDNALDAIGNRGRVTITASSRGDSILVRVADDGPGIPDDIRNRVFDPFFTTKPVGQGTGLGLDMARRIVHQHGGDIEFSSQPGRTVFKVLLPVSPATPVRVNPESQTLR